MSGNHKVELRFSALLRRKEQTAAAICHSLWRSGLLQGDETQVTALAANIALVGTFWISYQRALHPRADADIALGVFQVMQLVAPGCEPMPAPIWMPSPPIISPPPRRADSIVYLIVFLTGRII